LGRRVGRVICIELDTHQQIESNLHYSAAIMRLAWRLSVSKLESFSFDAFDLGSVLLHQWIYSYINYGVKFKKKTILKDR